MPIRFGVTSQTIDRARADLVAVPVFADRVPGPGADVVDRALGGRLADFLEEAGFTGKPGETVTVPTAGTTTAPVTVLVGVGARDGISTDVMRRAAAGVARRASRGRSVATSLLEVGELAPGAAAQALAEGFALGSYRFVEYKSDGETSKLATVTVTGASSAETRAGLERGAVVASAVSRAHDMVNEPSGAKSPAEFAAAARRLLSGKGVTVTVMSEAELRAQHMGGVIGVGQGSSRPPRFVKVVYQPRGTRAPGTLALVGKGVVFDSGGLSLKTAVGHGDDEDRHVRRARP